MKLSNHDMKISYEDLKKLLNNIPEMLTDLQPMMDTCCLTEGLTVSQQQAIFRSLIYSVILPKPEYTH